MVSILNPDSYARFSASDYISCGQAKRPIHPAIAEWIGLCALFAHQVSSDKIRAALLRLSRCNNGRPPTEIEKKPQMYLLRIWFSLSETAAEDAIL